MSFRYAKFLSVFIAALGLCLSSLAYGPSDYIQDGLTGQWDGLCNTTDGSGISDDATVGDIDVQTENTRINLRDHELVVHDWTHRNGKGWSVANPAAYLSSSVTKGTNARGRLLWRTLPMMIIVR